MGRALTARIEEPERAAAFWRVVSAAVRGSAHTGADLPCQDAFASVVTPGGVLVAAVADGAGSAALAELGARTAAGAAVRAAAERLGSESAPGDEESAQSLLTAALMAARDSVCAAAAERDVAVDALSSTLILVVAGDSAVATAQVGDGAVVVRGEDDGLITLSVQDDGEYVNETSFLSGEASVQRARLTVWRGRATHVAAFSDGLQRLALLMPQASPHEPFFRPLLHFASSATDEGHASAHLASFLASDRVSSRTDDDVTLLIATRLTRTP